MHDLARDSLRNPARGRGGRGRGLVLRIKGVPEEDAEVYSIGFAGSLLDRRFRTAEKAAKEIKEAKRKARGTQDVALAARRGIVRGLIVEISTAMAFGLAITSIFVGR
ncbi:hypothetical protein ACFY0A_02000 [Streptomyces sp. NPDC001698]|uniref:hypothetical protein n=1 Tax=unclassified Streptomyces TaxID=2593676 RepID=UPI0036A34CC0